MRSIVESTRAFEAWMRKRTDVSKRLLKNKQGKLVVASRSGHHVQLDEPDLVVRAVQQVLATRR
jgi:pimeloyl-ACP methyl ester carboxylesterase